MHPHPQTLWNDIRARVRDDVTDYAFHIWIDPLEPVAVEDDTLFVRAPRHIRTWVSERYAPLLSRTAQRTGSEAARVEVVGEEWTREAAAPASRAAGAPMGERLNPKYTFDQFVIGDGNRFAHAAALSVAEMPSHAYNPLFLHGPPGLGKTHLLHAVGNYVRRYGGGLAVRYATIESFTTEFVQAVRADGELRAFKERFRGIDVLLVDDIQFLADKRRTKEEFFHTFNALYESGSQLVISSDRPPAELADLEARLRERFAAGLVVEVEPPDFDVRLAILRQRARHDGLSGVADETLGAIARHVAGSVRSLEGALIRVVAYASLRQRELTPAVAQEVLEKLYPAARPRRCTVEEIQLATADSFGIEPAQIVAYDRRPEVSQARKIAMFLSRELTDQTLPAIGRSFGGRNHTTVLSAHRRIAAALGDDPATASKVAELRLRLQAADRER